ncbi:UNVERIFIED_CONTAM: hypothetical protein Sradi_0885900 [Sesamum radiatum]|uniref:Uncharacterized protein n=1 Tax=Sesamum radiatum TaxID=300843 RepID=A0AAW2V552_SESRA
MSFACGPEHQHPVPLRPGTWRLNTTSENQTYVGHALRQDGDPDVVPQPATDYYYPN